MNRELPPGNASFGINDLSFRSPVAASETEGDEESANDNKLFPPNKPEVESESENQYRNPKPEPAVIPEIHLAREPPVTARLDGSATGRTDAEGEDSGKEDEIPWILSRWMRGKDRSTDGRDDSAL